MRMSYIHSSSSRHSCQPGEAPYGFPGVEDEAKDGTDVEQEPVDSFFGAKLLCRDSGSSDGCEVTERDEMWVYAILLYGPGSHVLLTGVGVEGPTGSQDPEGELDKVHSFCGLGSSSMKPITVCGPGPERRSAQASMASGWQASQGWGWKAISPKKISGSSSPQSRR